MTILTWTPTAWAAFANLLLAVGAITAGGWAIYSYRQTRRLEAAKWLKQLFSDFYIQDTFANVRTLFEYRYTDTLGPLIERRITDRHILPSAEDIELLRELDTLLNYFEYLLYLEDEGHLSHKDRKAVFEYWFDLMNASTAGGLRSYARRFGFERIARALNINSKDYIAVYGSLMASVGGLKQLDIEGSLRYVGACSVGGRLYDLGEYPALVLDGGSVTGELYEVVDMAVFRKLDKFERYNAESAENSLYVRRCIRLHEPNVDAWIYVYNQSVEDKPLVVHGNWKEYLEGRKHAGLSGASSHNE